MKAQDIKKLNGGDKFSLRRMVDRRHVSTSVSDLMRMVIGYMPRGYWKALKPRVKREIIDVVVKRHTENCDMYDWIDKGLKDHGHCGQ